MVEKMRKECPDGKMLNPKTNRCVNENGAIGRKLREQAKSKHIIKHNISLKSGHSRSKHSNKTKKVAHKKVAHKKVAPKKESLIKKIRIKKTKKRLVLKSIKKTKKSTSNKPRKICPPSKVLNPKTNRCVNRNGVVAKKLGLA